MSNMLPTLVIFQRTAHSELERGMLRHPIEGWPKLWRVETHQGYDVVVHMDNVVAPWDAAYRIEMV